MYHFPKFLSIKGEEYQSLLHLLLCQYLPITTDHIHYNKIPFLCVNFLHRIITARYGEVEWASGLVRFPVEHTQYPLT